MTDEPLALTRQQAAALCQLSPSGFDSWVARGIVPPPIAGTRRWSRVALERTLAGEHANHADLSSFEQYEREKAEHERKQALRGSRLPDSTPECPARPLGKRERVMLCALRQAGGEVDNPALVPGGIATMEKLGLRGYLAPSHGFYSLKLTKDGKRAAEAIERY